jgi:hypothetical protein
MSRAGSYGLVLVAVAAASLVSCRKSQKMMPDPDDPTDPIRFTFTCPVGGPYSVGLAYTDQKKTSAWVIKKHGNDDIEWQADPSVTNVTFKLVPKTGSDPLPLDIQQENGKQLKAKVKPHQGGPKSYSYAIDATCTPPGPGQQPLRLIIDPEMIVR